MVVVDEEQFITDPGRGQSFITASTSLENQQLFHRYVLGRPEDLRSSFGSGSLATWVLRLLAQIARVPRLEEATLLANTYWATWLAATTPTGGRRWTGRSSVSSTNCCRPA